MPYLTKLHECFLTFTDPNYTNISMKPKSRSINLLLSFLKRINETVGIILLHF